MVPEHIWSKVDPTTFKNFPNPVWTGPYKLVSSSAEGSTWERNDDYWAKDVMGMFPAAKFVHITGAGPAEMMMMEQIQHRMDIWSEFSPSQIEMVMQKNKDVTVWNALDICTRALFLNSHKPGMDNPELRWAISYAINKEKMGLVAYEGLNCVFRSLRSLIPLDFDH